MPRLETTYPEQSNFRHDPETREQLEALKNLSGLKKSALIRKAVAEMHEREQDNAKIKVIIDSAFSEVFAAGKHD